MNTQKNAAVRQAGIIFVILLVLSVSYSVMMYMVSSGPLPPWQGPDIRSDMESGTCFQQAALSIPVEKSGAAYRRCSMPLEKHDDNTIIGPFRVGNYSIVLTVRGDKILESVSGNGNTWQYSLEPECINITSYDERSLGIADTTAGTALYRLPLQLPENPSLYPVKDIGIYDAWVERSWEIGMSKNIVHTGGRFYVIYGQEIIHNDDRSYSVSSPLFDQGESCQSETGYSDAVGWVSTDNTWTLRNFPLTVKYWTTSRIVVDNKYSTRFGIAMDKWFSTSLDREEGR